ncbi:hypothetical protein GDO86_003935 [Hymenochirus boettgeri]|uniref:Interphotoreceptor matrix proteoglycan 1 n=1 Tax=Hymenochirus boettgeri TaxID=247094 RepID=A0A8T2K7X4_9PIPI|nr:hypothetical protein GDO86_003935 [Hymenochirus boettgeri]
MAQLLVLLTFLCIAMMNGQQQTNKEPRTSLEYISQKGITDFSFETEPGSGLLSEESILPAASAAPLLYRSFLKRRKRSILFPSGVKVCPEETIEQALVNHLKFFKIRVCQETVWEVFKIFWDRLPSQTEYHQWVTLCEEGTMTAFEIGQKFSTSEEHHKLVMEKLSLIKQVTNR